MSKISGLRDLRCFARSRLLPLAAGFLLSGTPEGLLYFKCSWFGKEVRHPLKVQWWCLDRVVSYGLGDMSLRVPI